MREIKFRAWDKVVGCWSSSRQSSLAEVAILLDGSIVLADDCGTYQPSDYILEQFTGLKDKNGKEIYEGDILDGGMDGACVIFWHEKSLGWRYACDHASALPMYSMPVIGNIHENPELLK